MKLRDRLVVAGLVAYLIVYKPKTVARVVRAVLRSE